MKAPKWTKGIPTRYDWIPPLNAKSPPEKAEDFIERFMSDDIHAHYNSYDVCAEDLSLKYILASRIDSLFDFAERFDRFSWDNRSDFSDMYRRRLKIEVLEYMLKELKEQMSQDIEMTKRDLKRVEHENRYD